ncbi:MAG: M3 family oligoendopeptidase [Verrucomicrobium sp.]|nr:M3 family oligoendopeptidase [Verrucomicrobium sp.]
MTATAPTARVFLSADIDLADIAALEGVYQKLERNLELAGTVSELEGWLAQYGEVSDAVGEVRSARYIAMTCQTDDAARKEAYLHFVEVVDPWRKPREFELQKKLVAHPSFAGLPAYYEVFRRSVKNAVELFREANVPRETEIEKLAQEYQETCGAMTVDFDGKEQTLSQLGRVQEETDRARRQAAWEASTKRRLADRDKLNSIFDRQLALRQAVAKEAGFSNFRDYMFRALERFDYAPDDCLRFHEAVEREVVPVVRLLEAGRREKMGLEKLRPWDLSVDPEGRPPLRPFQNAAELFDKTEAVFGRIDARLRERFARLRQDGSVDLENRKGKAPGGYQSYLPESRRPFIFMNAVGTQRDVETLLHEGGHAIHALQSGGQRLSAYRGGAPMEFCEVASMSMELLGAPHLEEFYAEPEARRARRTLLEGVIQSLPSIAATDAFQHWIYTHPGHTPAERDAAWTDLMKRFGADVDWSGYEAQRGAGWHRILHIFEVPFYYIEYGIAQLGALQVWNRSLNGVTMAVDGYLYGLELGGSRPLPRLFEAAGIRFDFTRETIAPLMAAVKQELAKLEN